MAFARLALFPDGTQQQHEAIVEGLGAAYHDAPGRLMFAAGPTPEGWQILQIWETETQLEKWVEDNLGRAFAHAGTRGYPHPPKITDFELSEVVL